MAKTITLPIYKHIGLINISQPEDIEAPKIDRWDVYYGFIKSNKEYHILLSQLDFIEEKVKELNREDLVVLKIGQFYFIVSNDIRLPISSTPSCLEKHGEIKGMNEIISKYSFCDNKDCTFSNLETGVSIDRTTSSICSECKMSKYCSVKCQQEDQQLHQTICHLLGGPIDIDKLEHTIRKYPFPLGKKILYAYMDNEETLEPDAIFSWDQFNRRYIMNCDENDSFRLGIEFINKKIALLKKKEKEGLVIVIYMGEYYMVRRAAN
jgi:hypothetical protein